MKKWAAVGIFSAMTVAMWIALPDGRATTPAAPSQPPETPASSPAAAAAWTKLGRDYNALKQTHDAKQDMVRQRVTALMNEAHDFAAKYPADAHALQVTMLWAHLGDVMAQQGWPGGPSSAEVGQAFDRLAADKNVPEPDRAGIRAMQIGRAIQAAAGATGDAAAAAWRDVDERFDAFIKQFGADFSLEDSGPVVPELREQEILLLETAPASPTTTAMLQKLAQDPIKPIADLAAKALDHQQLVAGLKTKPFELKYTAADGSEVDVAKLRGKVVLVDFWATWCGPCVAEMPGVVGLYKKYHPQGFEIVGVSLDQEKGAMESFAKKAGMTWPQYFDGQIWDNKVSSGFGIDQVPQMWLLDKKGMLVATASSVDQVAGQVGELLKAP